MLSAEESIVKKLVQLFMASHRQTYEEEWAKLTCLLQQSEQAFKSHQAVLRQQFELNEKLNILAKEAQFLEAFCSVNEAHSVPQIGHLNLVDNQKEHITKQLHTDSAVMSTGKKDCRKGCETSERLVTLQAEMTTIKELQGIIDVNLESTKNEYSQVLSVLSTTRSAFKPVESFSSPRPLHKLLWPSTFSTAEDWKPWKHALTSLSKDPDDRISSKSLKDYVEKYKDDCDQAVYRTIDLELTSVESAYSEMKLSVRGEERTHKKLHAIYHSIMKKLQHELDHVSFLLEEFLKKKYSLIDCEIGVEQKMVAAGEDKHIDTMIARYKQLCMLKSTQLSYAKYQHSCTMHAVSMSEQRLNNLESQLKVIGSYYRSLLCKHMFDWPLPFPRQKAVDATEEPSPGLTDTVVVPPPVPLLEDMEKIGQELLQAQEKRLRDEYGSRLRGLVEEHKYTWDLFFQDLLGDKVISRQHNSLQSLPIIALKDSIEHWILQQATAEQIHANDQKRWEMYQRYKLQVKRKWDRAADLQQADIELYEFIDANKKRLAMLADVQPAKKGEGNRPAKMLTKESVNALMAEEQTIRMKTREMKFELRHHQETYLSTVDKCQELYEKWLKLARVRQDDWLAYLASQEGKVVVEDAESIEWRREEIDKLWLDADALAVRVQYEARQSRQLAQAAAKLSKHWEENNRRWLVLGELDSARRRYQSAITNAAAEMDDEAAIAQLALEKAAAQDDLYRLQDEYDQHGKLFYYLADHGPINDEDLRLARLKELEDVDRATVFKWNLVLQKQKKVHETFQPPPEEMILGIALEEAQTDRLSQHQELREVSYDAELRSYVNSVVRKWIYDKGDDWQSGVKGCAVELRDHALSMAITDSCELAEKAWTSIIATGLRALNKDNAVRKKSTSLKKQICMQEAALGTVRDARLVFVEQRKILDRLELVWSSILKERVKRRHEKCQAAARSYLKSGNETRDRAVWDTELTAEERAEYNCWAEKQNEWYQLQLAEEEQALKLIDTLLLQGEEKAAYFRKYVQYYNVDMLSVNQEITLRTLGVAREEYRRRFEPFSRRKQYLALGSLDEESRGHALRKHFKDDRVKLLHRLPQDMASVWQQHAEHILGHDRIRRQPYKTVLETTVSHLKAQINILHDYNDSSFTCGAKWLVMAKYCSKGLVLLKHDNVISCLQPYEFLHSETAHRLLDLIVCFQQTVAAALTTSPTSSHASTQIAVSNARWETCLFWLTEASFYLELASAVLYRMEYNGASNRLLQCLAACLQHVLSRSAATCTLLLGEPFDERSPIKIIKKYFLSLNEQYGHGIVHFLRSTSCTVDSMCHALNLLESDFSNLDFSFDISADSAKLLARRKNK